MMRCIRVISETFTFCETLWEPRLDSKLSSSAALDSPSVQLHRNMLPCRPQQSRVFSCDPSAATTSKTSDGDCRCVPSCQHEAV